MMERKGRTWLVTRHPGAVEWLRSKGFEIDGVLAHVDEGDLAPGDTVIGILPVHLAERVCRAGGRYLHLSLDLPADARGREISPDEMEKWHARLEEFFVRRP